MLSLCSFFGANETVIKVVKENELHSRKKPLSLLTHHRVSFFFLLDFFFRAGVSPVHYFPFWCFVGVRLFKLRIKALAAARVGWSGISKGCFIIPEEGSGRLPSCNSERNIEEFNKLLAFCNLPMLSCPDLPWPWMKFWNSEAQK